MGPGLRPGGVRSPRSGATVTGARMFLIAYNVNLNTNDDQVGQRDRRCGSGRAAG